MWAVTGDFEVLDVDAEHVMASAFNMLFVVWRRHTMRESFLRCVSAAQALSTAHGRGIGILQVLERGVLTPDAETRAVFPQLLNVAGVRHFSVTYEGTGFVAATVRAIMSTTYWAARPSFEHCVQARVSRAALWHAGAQSRLGRTETAREIEGVVEGLRALHRQRYPENARPGSLT